VVDGRVVGFAEKPADPRSGLANAGIYAFHPKVLDEIPEPLPRDIGFDLLPRLVGRARALALDDCHFLDIGTPAALEQARGNGKAGHCRDHNSDATSSRARRRWNGPPRLLPRARRRVLNAAIDKCVYIVVKQR
jgi:NDP-sugar pyrophosphorylase family protein